LKHSYPGIDSVSVIGNYLPRKCGIATFTSDLVQSLKKRNKKCVTLAINDRPEGYEYPRDVRFEINQNKLSDYYTAANYLNTVDVDVALVQHEFGIFGGDSGEYLLSLLDELKMPVITTLHTVLTNPSSKQNQVMKHLAELTNEFVVMSKTAIEILHTIYDIPRNKISHIPHGIPDMPFRDPNYYKGQFDLLGRKVLLTFGLLSKNKGIEYVIKGLPKVVERFPDVTYIVLGATHPNVLKAEGEKYRDGLQNMVKELNLENHVQFKNEFVPQHKLCEYLSASDVYITPYVEEGQITSGTLAYAAGAGKAIVSTPYWYAKEMLSDGRGKLVPFKNEEAMASAIINLFENEADMHKMRMRSYDYNRKATWAAVAEQYSEVFKRVKSNYYCKKPNQRNKNEQNQSSGSENQLKLPRLNIDHLDTLTDTTGMIQHATFTVSNRNHGYCTDDNARAYLAVLKAQHTARNQHLDSRHLQSLSNIYLTFLLHAFNPETGRFFNFMSYSREWLEESSGSEDSHGRAIWALGSAVSLAKPSSESRLALNLFLQGLPAVESFRSPRALAFSILGLDAYLKTFSGDTNARRIYSTLAGRLYDQFISNQSEEWPWLEDIVTYSNGKISHSLIVAGDTLAHKGMRNIGLKSLKWLLECQVESGRLVPVGNLGWFKRNGEKARFDQQPIEAHALIEACIAAYHSDSNKYWLNQANICFSWFLGNNDMNLPLYNSETGGCRDGLQANGINQNEGAESTLAWQLSLLAMQGLPRDFSLSLNKHNKIKLKSNN